MHRTLRILNRRTPSSLFPCSFSVVSFATTAQSEKLDAYSAVYNSKGNEKVKKINRAMVAYMESVQAHDTFMKEQSAEYELGKRHLANMMGVDAKTMTKQDVDDAITYLFPSGLFSKISRPMMKPPEDLYPPKKPVQFDVEGRPFHSLFYTILPNFYQILYDIREKIIKLQAHEDEQIAKGAPPPTEELQLAGTDWLSAEQLSKLTLERVHEDHRAQFVAAAEDLLASPYSYLEADFIKKHRAPFGKQVSQEMATLREEVLSTLKEDEHGRRTVTATGYRRRIACTVKLTEGGSGRILVDGLTLDKLLFTQSRENLLYPFILLNRLDQFDVESTHESLTGQFTRNTRSGIGENVVTSATRHGISLALLAFVTPEEAEKMRLAGLLTKNIRTSERKKIGQPGARAKWIWKKR